MSRPLILASTSATRRELLSRLGLDFDVVSPEVDETPLPAEAPSKLAERLARSEAHAVANQYPDHWVIGSDQVASLDTQQLHKPLTTERAIAQLVACRGRTVQFNTAVTLANLGLAYEQTRSVPFSVTFRNLDDDEIERYVMREQPLYCAGSFKVEGLGIALFERLHGDDWTALMGLPLIGLSDMLRDVGIRTI